MRGEGQAGQPCLQECGCILLIDWLGHAKGWENASFLKKPFPHVHSLIRTVTMV